MKRIKRHPRREKLIEQGKQSSFYGETVGEMDKEDLFMMIGHLGEAQAAARDHECKDWKTLGMRRPSR